MWLEELDKLNKSHEAWAQAQYAHYRTEKRGLMQKGRDALYSRRKQSQYTRWAKDLDQPQWVNWESTSEYDMDVDATVERLHEELRERVE